MKMPHELAQDYATYLRTIEQLKSCRNSIKIQIIGLENWGNAVVEIRNQLRSYLPQIIDGIMQKAQEDAAITKQELDKSLAKDGVGLKMVK